jgi:secretion/DNA translocation related TadE-like protein
MGGAVSTEQCTERCPERGAGTVLVLGVIAAILVLAFGIAALGAAQNARGAAQAAADLGALAGATALRDGFDPCGTARTAVARNGAAVAACEELGGGVVRVVVTRVAAGPGGALGEARASARAGPRAGDPGKPGAERE